ncbi:MAG TPA: VRR-NUC domain-containing protein [Clostridia bacterium]|nr:VRR-NUC domain-containing protein [Clostridia bacterium]
MLEKDIEKKLKEEIKRIGGRAFKFTSPGINGVPDRMVLYKGKCYFVELKKPGETPNKLQKAVHRKFKRLGFEVYIIDSLAKVGDFINEVHTT